MLRLLRFVKSGTWVGIAALAVVATVPAHAQRPGATPSPALVANLPGAGGRNVILVDASTAMGAESGAVAASTTTSRWERAARTVDWLIGRLPVDAQFQVILFNEQARALQAQNGAWFSAAQSVNRDAVARTLRSGVVPSGEANLAIAFAAAAALQPPVDRIYLIAAGLPGRALPADERIALFNAATKSLRTSTPVDVLLLPVLDSDEMAPSYWHLALSTGGSLMTMSPDWPPTATPAQDSRFATTHAVFVVDTSGSMRGAGWPRVRNVVREVLTSSPRLEAFRILNDQGHPLRRKSVGDWTPATPEAIEAVLSTLGTWTSESGSNTTRGILRAIALAHYVGAVAIYVLGDDLTSKTFATDKSDVLQALDGENVRGKVTVSTIAIPTVFEATGRLYTAAQFAMLQHELAVRSGGFFVSLPCDPGIEAAMRRRTYTEPDQLPPQCPKRNSAIAMIPRR